MRRIAALILAISALLLAVSCAGREPEPTQTDTQTEEPVRSGESGSDPGDGNEAFFTLRTIDGEKVSSTDFPDAKLYLINFFEPWCGPCVSEMPALEQISEEYADKGLVVIGMFYTAGVDDSVRDVVDYTGVTYPILFGDAEFVKYTSQYVPTTVFFDGDGNPVGEQLVGARNYQSWVSEVEKLLG